MSELASFKTIPFRYSLSPENTELIIKYTVPAIYALWEGFVKNAFEFYIKEINNNNISVNDVHLNILVHFVSSHDKLRLENARLDFTKQKEFIECYHNKINQPICININRSLTKSNLNFDVTNDILIRFNLKTLPANEFNDRLNKLLHFRNKIAHGDKSISVTMNDIESFSKLVNDLMSEILLCIEDGHKNKTFLKTM
jgi:hypothetical protein